MRSNDRKKLPELFPKPEILKSAETASALKAIVENVDKNAIKPDIYKGKYQKEPGKYGYSVRERLTEIYYKKCAYCEKREGTPEVEHFRPMRAVQKEEKDKKNENHPGYYWLCYEWTNLLPSCHYCNTGEGKRNQFPIRGIRIYNPPSCLPDGSWNQEACDASKKPLIEEKPYLLHPEIDRPDDGTFFKFYNTGRMEGIDPEGRGEKTIDICKLNRDNLVDGRREKINIIVERIKGFLVLWFEGDLTNAAFKRALDSMVFGKMVKMQQPDQPFSLLAIYIFEHFDEIIAPELPTPAQGKAVSAAFANFRKRLKYDRNLKLMLKTPSTHTPKE